MCGRSLFAKHGFALMVEEGIQCKHTHSLDVFFFFCISF